MARNTTLCRDKVLPLLLGGVLPACGEGALHRWLVAAAGGAGQPSHAWVTAALQVGSVHVRVRWRVCAPCTRTHALAYTPHTHARIHTYAHASAIVCMQELQWALSFACSVNGARLVTEVMQVCVGGVRGA